MHSADGNIIGCRRPGWDRTPDPLPRPLPQGYDTELLLPRDTVCVPVQPVVVVKRESEPSPISFMGALRIPVSYYRKSFPDSCRFQSLFCFLFSPSQSVNELSPETTRF